MPGCIINAHTQGPQSTLLGDLLSANLTSHQADQLLRLETTHRGVTACSFVPRSNSELKRYSLFHSEAVRVTDFLRPFVHLIFTSHRSNSPQRRGRYRISVGVAVGFHYFSLTFTYCLEKLVNKCNLGAYSQDNSQLYFQMFRWDFQMVSRF